MRLRFAPIFLPSRGMPVAAGFDPAYLCYLHAALYR